MNYFQTKSFSLQIKDIDTSKRIVKGYFSSFNFVDSDNELITPGAFQKSLVENGVNSSTKRIKHLFNHWDTAGVLQELKEDNFGLYFESQLGRHTLGNDVLMMYEDGIITEHSIGFKTTQSKQVGDVKHLTEVQLWEGSSLDKWGANMNTPALKSDEKANLYIERIDLLTKAIRNGRYSDDRFDELIIQLKQVQQHLYELISTQPDKTTEPETEQKSFDYDKLIELFN